MSADVSKDGILPDSPLLENIDFESVFKDFNIEFDPIDATDFDEVAYINELFPSEQSLASIDEVMNTIAQKIQSIDEQTRQIVHGQWKLEEQGPAVVAEASQMIQSLFVKIREVQERATSSERMVAEITSDIQQLDQAKRNLTLSITTLNNLALIVGDIDRLNSVLAINTCAAKEANSTNPFDKDKQPSLLTVAGIEDNLARAQRLMEPMFSAYSTVPAIKELDAELSNIFEALSTRLPQELKDLLNGPPARVIAEHAPKILAGCRLLDLLPSDKAKMDLVQWFVSNQLLEYQELYEPSQAVAWLDKIDHRYAWLRTNLTPMERKIRALFPPEWLVLERLIVEFCRITRKDLEITMQRRRADITHTLLVFALQRTLAFETSLSKVASGATLGCASVVAESQKKKKPSQTTNPFGADDDDDGDEKDAEGEVGSTDVAPPPPPPPPPANADANEATPKSSTGSAPSSPFEGIISRCFDPYFDLYLNYVERALHDQLVSRLLGDMSVNKSSLSTHEFGEVLRDGVPANSGVGATGGGDMAENTLYSATDLFLLYKQLLKQTLQLNRGKGLVGLANLLRKYLSEYTEKVLCHAIPGLTNSSSLTSTGVAATASKAFSLASLGLLRDDSRDTTESAGHDTPVSALTAATNLSNQFFANLLRDEQPVRLSKDEVVGVCVILVTASYCIKTVEELEKRLKSEVRPASLAKSISFSAEIDALADCRSACVHRLVADLEASVIPQLNKMTKMPWNSLTAVGDQSAYVTAIISHLRTQVPIIRDTLYSVRAHFTQICIKFADSIINRFVASLYRCKPVNTFGAEQLLLDTQCLKSALLQLPLFGTKISQPPPRSFLGLVQGSMAHAERIIKTVMLPIGTPPTSTAFAGGTVSAAAQTATSAGTAGAPAPVAVASTNPFDAPIARSEEPSDNAPVLGFVMGPVDAKAAETFVKSFFQLLPDADVSVLQKVLDMKGVKRVDQFPILDYFREAVKARNDSKNADTSGSTSALHSGSSVTSSLPRPASSATVGPSKQQQQLQQERQNPQSRMRQLEGLLQKKH
ncbi:Vacuolar protein sorting-associated protein 53 [Sparganum proliferum]